MTLRFGLHASPRGHTQRSIDTFAAAPVAACLWLGGNHQPGDAMRTPDAWHLVRLPTPAVDEDIGVYTRSVARIIEPWRAAEGHLGALWFIPGNEPEYEDKIDVLVAWQIGAWLTAAPAFAAALRAYYPGIALAAPALMADNTDALTESYCAAFDVTTCHCYWQVHDEPGIEWGGAGGAWVYARANAGGRPVIVTEVGVVSESGRYDDGNMDWEKRNRQLLKWRGEAEAGGVAAACVFVADASPDFSCFDVGPEAWAALNIPVAPPIAPPEPPQPPEETPVGYSRNTDPRGYRPLDQRWRDYIYGYNPDEAAAIWQAYNVACQITDYDPNCALAQGCVETAVFTSPRWRNAHNAAGIGIYADETPDVDFRTIERGIRAQVELLSDYYGSGVEPWGILREFGFGGMRLNLSRLSDMDGKWAADTGYSAAIVGHLNAALGGTVPDVPDVPDVPQRYRFVEPVDCPVLQGSDGPYSHAGTRDKNGNLIHPTFFAIDSGCAFNTPVRSIADGTVIYNGFNHPLEGQTGHTICVRHDGGYESRYCHLSEYETPVGASVMQGQIIAHTGAPDYPYPGANGYGEGAHLHWSVSLDGHWIKVEDLEAAGEMGQWNAAPPVVEEVGVMPVTDGFSDGEIKRLWFSTDKPTKAAAAKTPYNPDFGIPQHYAREANRGVILGKAISAEESDPGTPGRVVQYFSGGKITASRAADGTWAMHTN